MVAAGERRWRVNGVIGKVVPVVLLVYLVLAYWLVVVDYSIKRLAVDQGRTLPAVFFVTVAHALFLPALWAYLRVFLARPGRNTGAINDDKYSFWYLFGGVSIPSPPNEPPVEIAENRIIFQCDANGQPLRCFRDECKGRWKPARSRHCGDCRQCRVSFDHHCPWFDADIIAPDTLLPFLFFLLLVPFLLLFVFAPLIGLSYRHLRHIWRFAAQSEDIKTKWWARRRSWTGGPMFRWIGGLYLGSRRCCLSVDDYFDSPNLYVPIMTFLAAALILIASALLVSTLQQLFEGDLTIDTRIRKLLRKKEMKTEAERQKWQQYFWVPLAEEPAGGAVVALAAEERPYDLGSWRENVKAFLCLQPYTPLQLQLQWPISTRMRASLIARAQSRVHKDA